MSDVPSLRSAQTGFSLIEVLIALAITSIIAALIFSSLVSQVTQADSVRRSSQSAFDAVTSRRLAELVVSRTVPAWADEEVGRFTGTQTQVSGLSAVSVFGEARGLQAYTLSLVPDGGEVRLTIEVGGRTWIANRFPASARFRFLGAGGGWQDRWPVEASAASSLDELEAQLMDGGLPLMISVWDITRNVPLGLELKLQNSGELRVRARDLIGDALP